jgi:hypothetical protein
MRRGGIEMSVGVGVKRGKIRVVVLRVEGGVI